MKQHKVATVEEELKKNPQLKEEDIRKMRQWVKEEISLPSITDMLLVLFLHCSDYDIEVAKSTLVKYYNAIYNSPQLFLHRNPTSDEIVQITKIVGITMLDGRDRDGNVILFHRLLNTDTSQFNMDLAMKYGIMTCVGWLKEHGTTCGIVLVYDQKGFGLGHVARGSLSTIRTMVHYVQDCVPFNIRHIHVINTNAFFEAILAFFKPFMRSSLLSKIQAHREGSMEEFFQYVPQEILPAEYGGKEATLAELSEKMHQHLVNMKDYFDEEDQKGYAEMEQWKSTRSEGILQRVSSWFR